MKLFISADIEGVAGIAKWNETENGAWYDYFTQQMTAEVAAACRGALDAGVTEIYVKDGHHLATNIHPEKLPKEAILNRGWAGDGYGMMSGVQDGDVDCVVMIGYHSKSYSNQNPLSHTSENYIRKFSINDELVSEFSINRLTAAFCHVPVIFVSGDQGLIDDVHQTDAAIGTFATLQGRGGSTTSVHPEVATDGIYAGVKAAILAKKGQVAQIPATLDVKIEYQEQNRARQASLFPGARLLDPYTVGFVTNQYFEFLRFYSFVS
jgi:D-amino peptidase